MSTDSSFADLEIRIFGREEAGYPVEITLEGQQEFPRSHLSSDIVPWVSSGVPVQDGQQLFETLLADSSLRSAWAQAKGQAPQRRIRLRIDETAAELHALPWELLHEGAVMLSAQRDTPFSRYLPIASPWGSPVRERPIRVLVAIANPDDLEEWYNLAPVDVGLERDILQSALTPVASDELRADYLDPPLTLERLEEALREGYHVLHLVGHGAFSTKRGQAALYLQNSDGSAQRVLDDDFVNMIAYQGVQPRLILLVACQSATRSTSDALLGLGPKLVTAGVPAVVAMQDAITVETARRFSATFYRRLLAHNQVDTAVNEARATLLTSGRPDAGVPVLFMRLASGELWETEIEPGPTPTPGASQLLPPPEPMPPPNVEGFVGREVELDYYADKLTTSRLAVITGMPGMGKSSLAAKLAAQVSDPQRIFWHTFHEGQSLSEMIWRLAGFLYWRQQKGLWKMLQNTWRAGGQSPPQTLLLDYLFQRLHDQDYLLCFDNLHYVENDPLLDQFIERMCLALPKGGLAWLITSQSIPPFASGLGFKPLTGLSFQDTLDLFAHYGLPVNSEERDPIIYTSTALLEAKDLLATDLVANLHARTDGNPHLLTLAVDALKHASNPVRFIVRLFEDQNVERFLAEQIDTNLSVEERAVMSGVAVLLGYPGTRRAIETVLSKENIRHTLNDLSQRNLLNLSQGKAGHEYSMNAVVRHYYYDTLTQTDQNNMHRRAGEYYETQEPNPLVAARHFHRAGEVEQAARLATADIRASINQGQARTLKSLLERFTPQQVDRQQWVEINLALGEVQTFLEEIALAQQSFQRALDNIPLLSGSREMKSKVTLPKIWDKLKGRHKKTDLTTIFDKLQESDERDSPAVQSLRARAYRNMGELLRHKSPQQALEWLRRGLEALAEADDLTLERVAIYNCAAVVHLDLGNYDTALEQYERALAILPQGPNRWRAAALHGMGTIYTHKGDPEQSRQYAHQALEISQQLHDHFQTMRLWHSLGISTETVGDWDGAAASYQQALTLAEQLGRIGRQVLIENSLGVLRTKQGDHESAKAHLSRALKLVRAHPLKKVRAAVLASLSELSIEMKDWIPAQTYLKEAETLALELDSKYLLSYIYCGWAQCHLASGTLQIALDDAARAVNLAHETGSDIVEGIGRRVLAQTLWANDQQQPALNEFEQSLSLLIERAPYEAARTQLQWGQAQLASGEPEQAADLLRQARATFAELGAQRELAAVDELLESATAKPSAPTRKA